MKTILTQTFDFFLPRLCPGCNKKLSANEEPVCEDCLSSILIADEVRIRGEFERNFGSAKIIAGFYSKFVFETDKTLQHIIHALKYNQKFKLGLFLGKILAEGIKLNNWNIDIIIPVPIHHLKKAERSYNQSDYIAKGISLQLEVPYSTNLIKRTRYTESQTKLNMSERVLNVSNAFKVRNAKKLFKKNILLVDDVCTTGATMLECAKVLVNAGVNSVYVCSIAIAE